MKLPISLNDDHKTGCLRKNTYEISLKIHVLSIKKDAFSIRHYLMQ